MIRATHCQFESFAGSAIGGIIPKLADNIFIDCYQAVDNYDDLMPVVATIQRNNNVARYNFGGGTSAPIFIMYNLFIRIETDVLKWSYVRTIEDPTTTEPTILHNTFYDCDTAFEYRDFRKATGHFGYTGTPPQAVFMRSNLGNQVTYFAKLNYGLLWLEYNLISGTIIGTAINVTGVTYPTNLFPLITPIHVAEPDNLRLVWAGFNVLYDEFDILTHELPIPLEDSPGAFVADDGTDMGAYHQGDGIVQFYTRRVIQLESPPGTTWEVQALQPNRIEGLTSVATFALKQFVAFMLDYSNAEQGTPGVFTAHALRAIRDSSTPSEWFPFFSPGINGTDERSRLGIKKTATYITRYDQALGLIEDTTITLKIDLTNWTFSDPKGLLSGPLLDGSLAGGVDKNNWDWDWFDGYWALAYDPTTIDTDYRDSVHYYIVSSKPEAAMIDEIFLNPVPKMFFPPSAPTNLNLALVKAFWMGTVTIYFLDDETTGTRLNKYRFEFDDQNLPLGAYDGMILTLFPPLRIGEQIAEVLATGTLNPLVFDRHRVIDIPPTRFYLECIKPVDEGNTPSIIGTYGRNYYGTPIDPANPFYFKSLTEQQNIDIQQLDGQWYPAKINSVMISPQQDAVNTTNQSAGSRDVWFDRGSQWYTHLRGEDLPVLTKPPAGLDTRKDPEAGRGQQITLLETAPHRRILPFTKGPNVV